MAGHNKWSKIRHRKAIVDKRRGKVWTKISKALIVAARHGGSDPDSNLTLRYAIDEARYANMPRDTVERAIKKGAGGEDTSDYEHVRYEGYAPGGIAVIVDALTDNRTRTVNEVRLAFSDHDSNLGASGCVAYMFQSKGQIAVTVRGYSDERMMEVALEAGASDVESLSAPTVDEPPTWLVSTHPNDFHLVRERLEKAGLTIADAQIAMVPDTFSGVSGDKAKLIENLVEALEDLDDVQKVFTNAQPTSEE